MKIKRILLATNLPIAHFAYLLSCMQNEGLTGIETYPNFTSEITEENACILAYVAELPKDVFDFINKHEGADISLYLDHEASLKLSLDQLDSFWIRDEPTQVAEEVNNLLRTLLRQ